MPVSAALIHKHTDFPLQYRRLHRAFGFYADQTACTSGDIGPKGVCEKPNYYPSKYLPFEQEMAEVRNDVDMSMYYCVDAYGAFRTFPITDKANTIVADACN